MDYEFFYLGLQALAKKKAGPLQLPPETAPTLIFSCLMYHKTCHNFCNSGKPIFDQSGSNNTLINMIGDMIGELTGKVVGKRIVRCHGGDLKIERTIESRGKVLGTEVTFIATMKAKERTQGGMYSEGNGVLMTMAGEKVILHGSAIGMMGKGGTMSMRGIRYAQTTAPALSRLNNIGILLEIEIMQDGTVHDKMWEWK